MSTTLNKKSSAYAINIREKVLRNDHSSPDLVEKLLNLAYEAGWNARGNEEALFEKINKNQKGDNKL